MNIINRHLWMKILLITGTLVTIIIFVIVFSLNYNSKNVIKKSIVNQSMDTGNAVYLGFIKAISTGKTQDVEEQFKFLTDEMPENKIDIFDYDGLIIYSSNSNVGNSVLMSKSEIELQIIDDLLKKGQMEQNYFLKEDNSSLSIFKPILNSEACFHCHGSSKNILGGMKINIPTEQAFSSIKKSEEIAYLYGVIGLLLLLLILYVYMKKYVNTPLTELVNSLKDIAEGEGDLTKPLKVNSKDEIGEVSFWFNKFLESLRLMINKLKQQSEELYEATLNISTAMEEMESTSKEIQTSILDTESQMKSSSTYLSSISEEINHQDEIISKMGNEFSKVRGNSMEGSESISKSVSEMESIQQQSENIMKMINLIIGIAKQTNLLSLNAAIEAAKAGSQGRGFAVVAEEVRKLAEKTSEASDNITSTVTDSNVRITLASQTVFATGKVLFKIVESVEQVSEFVEKAKEIANLQTGGIGNVLNSVDEVNNLTIQNASATTQLTETIAEISKTANQLADVSEQLKEQVGKFRT